MTLSRIFLFVFSCTLSLVHGQTNVVKPFVLGTIHEIDSKILGEKRTLNIYLPEGYSDTVKYPVVYLLDGSADEDFIHVVGLYQFNNFPWVNSAPKSIIVGIANVDRKRDFTFKTSLKADAAKYPTTGHSDKFIQFIATELQPYIDKTFHTSGSRTIIGQSLGGLLAAEILLKHSELFNQYILISPSMWWDNGSLLNASLSSILAQKEVYIGVGKEGLTPTEIPHVMEVDANILAEKLRQEKLLNVHFDYLPAENHASIGHQAIMNALKVFQKHL